MVTRALPARGSRRRAVALLLAAGLLVSAFGFLTLVSIGILSLERRRREAIRRNAS